MPIFKIFLKKLLTTTTRMLLIITTGLNTNKLQEGDMFLKISIVQKGYTQYKFTRSCAGITHWCTVFINYRK